MSDKEAGIKEAGIEVQGTVDEALAGGMYRVKVDQGPVVLAYASGKMKKSAIATALRRLADKA